MRKIFDVSRWGQRLKIEDIRAAMLSGFVFYIFLMLPAVLFEAYIILSREIMVPWYYLSPKSFVFSSLLIGIICSFVAAFIYVVSLYSWRVLAYLLDVVFLSASVVSVMYAVLYESYMPLGAIASLIQTNSMESSDYVESIPHVVYSIPLIYFVYYLLILKIRRAFAVNKSSYVWTPVLILAAVGGSVVVVYFSSIIYAKSQVLDSVVWRVININYSNPVTRPASGLWLYFSKKKKLKKFKEERLIYRYSVEKVSESPDLVVLVLGESLRRDHMALYGYRLNTTPLLGEMNLVVFDKPIAPAPLTIYSIPKILTEANPINPDLFSKRPSILSIAKQAGYRTYWISNQGIFTGQDEAAQLIALEADEVTFVNTHGQNLSYDGKLLPVIGEVMENSSSKKKFIVIHMMGSHQAFKRRYPAEFEQFSEEDYLGLEDELLSRTLLSEYDNSVLYTDYVVSKIIYMINSTGRSSFLAFVADHGLEIFGNTNFIGHGRSKVSYQVPFFIWTNVSILRDKAEKSANIEFGLENIFYLLSTVFGVRYPEYREERDILSDRYRLDDIYVSDPSDSPVLYESLK